MRGLTRLCSNTAHLRSTAAPEAILPRRAGDTPRNWGQRPSVIPRALAAQGGPTARLALDREE